MTAESDPPRRPTLNLVEDTPPELQVPPPVVPPKDYVANCDPRALWCAISQINHALMCMEESILLLSKHMPALKEEPEALHQMGQLTQQAFSSIATAQKHLVKNDETAK